MLLTLLCPYQHCKKKYRGGCSMYLNLGMTQFKGLKSIGVGGMVISKNQLYLISKKLVKKYFVHLKA